MTCVNFAGRKDIAPRYLFPCTGVVKKVGFQTSSVERIGPIDIDTHLGLLPVGEPQQAFFLCAPTDCRNSAFYPLESELSKFGGWSLRAATTTNSPRDTGVRFRVRHVLSIPWPIRVSVPRVQCRA